MSKEQIWAPWRLQYVQNTSAEANPREDHLDFLPEADPDCFLCQAAAGAADLRRRYVVHRGKHSLVVLNRFPYNNGHLLVAPLQHRSRLDQLPPAELCELTGEIARMVGVLERVLHPDGFNVGLNLGRVAGAGLPGHLHWHIVPRWNGDTNFMPVLASVHVIPQSLDALWEAVTAELAKHGG